MVVATGGAGEAGTGEADSQAGDQGQSGTPKGPVGVAIGGTGEVCTGEAGMGEANDQAGLQDPGDGTGEAGTGEEGPHRRMVGEP